MKQMVRGMMTMGLLVAASGCYEHTYTVGQGAPVGPVVYSEWHSSWLGGLIGERNIVVDRVCPSGNATIHDEMSFLNGLVATLTAGIYTPTEVKIRCDTGVAVGLQLDEQDVQSIVSSPVFLDRVERLIPERSIEVETEIRALASQATF